MAKLSFKTLDFEEKEDHIVVTFLRLFYFNMSKDRLSKIGKFEINRNEISFDVPGKRAARKFNELLAEGFRDLKNKLNDKKAIYIHKNSGIPLTGYISFGVIDRGTNLLEVRPITGCNLKCVYCSVDEDKRVVDFVVEKDYLVEEFKKIVEYKEIDDIEAHISSQGETVLYADLVELIKDISQLPQVKRISIDTNGTLLSKKLIDELIQAGLTQFNLSINAFEQSKAQEIADAGYNLEHIKEIAKYISDKAELLITPVWIPGVNDKDMGDIIEFTKTLKNKRFTPKACLQNFLNYKYGRNPVRAIDMDIFYKRLKELGDKHKTQLMVVQEDFSIRKTKTLEKPFKKGKIVNVDIMCPGRLPGEMLAVAKGRVIAVRNCKNKPKAKVKITKTKHNLFYGLC